MLMEESTDNVKERKKFEKKVSIDDHTEDEYHIMLKEEEKEKARKRTRGPYRKSSRAGL